MNHKKHLFLNLEILLTAVIFSVGLLFLPGQTQAAYKISYDNTSFVVNSLTINVGWNALGFGSSEGVKPYFAVNGAIKQYDYGTPAGFSANLQVGNNTLLMHSDAGDYDGCDCSSYDNWAWPDAVYASITFSNGKSLSTDSSWGGSPMILPSRCSPNYPYYIQTKLCDNCCETRVSKSITVVSSVDCSSDNGCAANICIGQTCWNGCANVPGTKYCPPSCSPNCNNSGSYCTTYTGNCGQTCTGTKGNCGNTSLRCSNETWLDVCGVTCTGTKCCCDATRAPLVCEGDYYEDSCYHNVCPGTMKPSYTPPSPCSKSCGGGTSTRQGTCTPDVTVTCNTKPCPPGYREVTPW